MSIKLRLIYAFTTIVLIVGIIGFFMVGSIYLLTSNYSEYERTKKISNASSELLITLQKMKSAVDEMALGIGMQGKGLPSLQTQMKQKLNQWKLLSIHPSERQEFENFESQAGVLSGYFDEVTRLAEREDRGGVIRKMEDSVLPELSHTTQALKLFTLYKTNQSDLLIEQIEVRSRRAIAFAWVLFVGALLLGAIFAVRLYRAIVLPLDRLQEGIQRLGEGEWDIKFDKFNVPEIEQVAKTMENMAGSLKELQSKVIQMDRMAAVGTLAGGVAHELNNPLTGVIGVAQVLLTKFEPQDARKEMVDKIVYAANRCQKIVHSLLTFSHQSEVELVPTDLHQVMEQTLLLCKADVESRKIDLIFEPGKDVPPVLGSSQHIQQVFLNLIVNATDAMPDGGTLRIGLSRQGTEVLITFKDTGIGIEPEALKKIFDPFFTTKDIGKGTGLGLSVSFSIIERHKGVIEAFSEGKGKGTTFIVRLPAAPSPKS